MTEAVKEQARRVVPSSDLDFNLITTDAVWGSPYISKELQDKLGSEFVKEDENGKKVIDRSSLWGLLGFYTRDMRLANLSYWTGEINYCQHYLDLANDFLQNDMIRPFLISLSRVATVLELSQSKGGFLRRRMHTFTSESITEQEPKKTGIFGGQKRSQ